MAESKQPGELKQECGQQILKQEGESAEGDNNNSLTDIDDAVEIQQSGQLKLEGEYESAMAVSDKLSIIQNIPDAECAGDLPGYRKQELEEECENYSAIQDIIDTPTGSSSMGVEAAASKDLLEHDYPVYDSSELEGGCYKCSCGCGSLATDCKLVSSKQEQLQPKMTSNDRFNTQFDRMILVGNLSPETENSDLTEYFGTYGTIDRVYVKRDYYTRASMKFAYVIFSSTNPINKVLVVDHVINDKHIQVKKARQDSGIIFVSNLGANLSECDIMSFYSEYGRVIDVHIVHTQRYAKNKRCCFVKFESGDIAQKVIASRRTVINGKSVKLQAFEDTTGAPTWMSQMDGDIEKLYQVFQDWDSFKYDYSKYDFYSDYSGGYYDCSCGCGYSAADCPKIQ